MGGAIRTTATNKINLENVSLVWLDGSVNKLQESIDAQKQLKLLTNHLEVFEKVDLCENYIKQLPKTDQIILIVSGSLGQQIVPRIHTDQRIVSIFVYCGDRLKNEPWTKPIRKVINYNLISCSLV